MPSPDISRFNVSIKWLPLVMVFLILIGLVHKVIFYWMFDINMLEFVTVGDAVIGCVPLVIGSVLSIILAYYENQNIESQFRAEATLNELQNKHANAQFQSKDRDDSERKFRTMAIRHTVIAILSWIIILVAFNLSGMSNWFNESLRYLIIIGIVVVGIIFREWIDTYYWGQKYILLTKTFKFFVLINLYLLYGNLTSAIDRKDGESRRSVKIIHLTDNTAVKLDSSLIYVGRLENYTFLYNTETKDKEVINNRAIKDFSYR